MSLQPRSARALRSGASRWLRRDSTGEAAWSTSDSSRLGSAVRSTSVTIWSPSRRLVIQPPSGNDTTSSAISALISSRDRSSVRRRTSSVSVAPDTEAVKR